MQGGAEPKKRVAVIGAGVSGLACARVLTAAGLEVRLFDKGQRAPGGRVHSRLVRLDAQGRVVPHHRTPAANTSAGVDQRCAAAEVREVEEELSFDDGAQYFTARAPEFRAFVAECVAHGCVREWQPLRLAVIDREGDVRLKPASSSSSSSGGGGGSSGDGGATGDGEARFVGCPTMHAFIPRLAQPVAHAIAQAVRVTSLRRRGAQWGLVGEQGDGKPLQLGEFDAVVVGVPAPQAAELLGGREEGEETSGLRAQAASVHMHPCWAVGVAFDRRQERLEFEGAFVNDRESPLSWIARNSSKPDRAATITKGASRRRECWMLHGSAEWSTRHLEDDPQSVAAALVAAFKRAVGGALDEPSFVGKAFRWRYAIPANPLPERFVYDEALRVGLCGDWVGGPRIEGAFMSGHLLGQHIASLAASSRL